MYAVSYFMEDSSSRIGTVNFFEMKAEAIADFQDLRNKAREAFNLPEDEAEMQIMEDEMTQDNYSFDCWDGDQNRTKIRLFEVKPYECEEII